MPSSRKRRLSPSDFHGTELFPARLSLYFLRNDIVTAGFAIAQILHETKEEQPTDIGGDELLEGWLVQAHSLDDPPCDLELYIVTSGLLVMKSIRESPPEPHISVLNQYAMELHDNHTESVPGYAEQWPAAYYFRTYNVAEAVTDFARERKIIDDVCATLPAEPDNQ